MKDSAYIRSKLEQYSEYITESGCRIWLGAHNLSGYGQLRVDGKCYLAHRLAWQLKHGPIPDGVGVLHRCDVTFCINENHLFLGTQQDNADDMKQKRRHKSHKGIPYMPRGRYHAMFNVGVKLTRDKAMLIRNASGTQSEIAALFGVDPSMVSKIKHGRHWKDPD